VVARSRLTAERHSGLISARLTCYLYYDMRSLTTGDPMLFLGIDTSCDDTSCAIVEDGWRILSNIVSSQVDLHSRYGGVVPEIASRKHLEMMVPVTDEALRVAGAHMEDIGAVAVTSGPGLLGSLLVGLCFGKSLASGLSIPLVGVHHLEGHMLANFLRDDPPGFPLLNLVVSGGHSDLILMRDFGSYELLGETRDDAAGEIFDKVARELGLPFPGGPYLDRAADGGDPASVQFTHPRIQGSRFDYSFSGMKTRALQALEALREGKTSRQGRPGTEGGGAQALRSGPGRDPVVAGVAASLRRAVVMELLYHVPEVLRMTGAGAFAMSGGVAANSLLRSEAARLCQDLGIPLCVPPSELCTDNGAMIAAAGFRRLLAGKTDGPDLNAEAGLELKSW